MIAEMPELGSLDRRQIAALAGLAPWTRQSGRWRGKSFIGGGRSRVRDKQLDSQDSRSLLSPNPRFGWFLRKRACLAVGGGLVDHTKIGCTAQTLNEWVKKAERDSGFVPVCLPM